MEKNFAVLIGIDDYSPLGIISLEGAVNDVEDCHEWLRNNNIVLEENIFEFTTKGNDQRPTYENIKHALDYIKDKSLPGAFIFIHYSGHGSRRSSVLPHRQEKNVKDEILLFQSGYLRDFEFGAILDELAKDKTVFVVLDCCYSADQDRDELDEPGTRLVLQSPKTLQDHEIDAGLLRGLNEAPESWWDRPRNYTLLAACGKHEKSHERENVARINGLFTYWTLEALKMLYGKKGPFNYERLLRLIRACMEDELRKNQKEYSQAPELMGQCNRLLFQQNTLSPTEFAFVSHLRNGNKVIIDIGKAHGVAVGAQYRIYGRSFNTSQDLQSQALGVITVSLVGGLASQADLPPEVSSNKIFPGCLVIPVSPAPLDFETIRDLENEDSLINHLFSFERVGVNQSQNVKHGTKFHFQFKNKSPFPLYFALFNLDPLREVRQLLPRQGLGLKTMLQQSSENRSVTVTIPESMTRESEATDIYKVFVSTRPTCFGMHQSEKHLNRDACREFKAVGGRGDLDENEDEIVGLETEIWQTAHITINITQ